tara:strand:- start:5 stop:460 length:456 start_codon:yes stop_codon:yes gene_type:complete
MSKIASLHAQETTIEVEYPEIDGFVISLVYLNRDDLMKIRNRSLTYKFNKRTRQREEEIDNDKFLDEYTKRAIKGWKGLFVRDLPQLLPIDMTNADASEEITYNETEALELIKNSTVFDQFITDAMQDYEQFTIESKEQEIKNSKTSSPTT